MEDKCDWYGQALLVVDRWFTSSRLCANCGAVNEAMPLKVRQWICGCVAVPDRDVNAAENIAAAGPAVSACGADVRLKRRKPGGQTATKQKNQPVTVGIPRL
ncbi:hypothetical protein Acsp04_64440 [Actinomadura sp. NBRC 104425]|nr:hypothetical protein Acsp04_64440 [Actinomadura sp. NBRC 104425]